MPPGDGSDINIMTYTTGAMPAALDQNPGWQEVNRQVSANLKINMTPFADYFGTKLQVTIAGGELPDLFFIIADPGITLVPEFFNAKVADLTPASQRRRRQRLSQPGRDPDAGLEDDRLRRQDLRRAGAPAALFLVVLGPPGAARPGRSQTADQRRRAEAAAVQFTQPQQGLWGQGVEAGPIYAHGLWMGLFTSIFGAPEQLGGRQPTASSPRRSKPTSTKPPPRTSSDLYTAGIFHPDSSNYNTISARDAFQARKFAYRYDGLEMFGWRKPPVQLTRRPTFRWSSRSAPTADRAATGSAGRISATSSCPRRCRRIASRCCCGC